MAGHGVFEHMQGPLHDVVIFGPVRNTQEIQPSYSTDLPLVRASHTHLTFSCVSIFQIYASE